MSDERADHHPRSLRPSSPGDVMTSCHPELADRVIGVVVEDKGDTAGADDEATPNTVGDAVRRQEPRRHGAVVEGGGGANKFESGRDLGSGVHQTNPRRGDIIRDHMTRETTGHQSRAGPVLHQVVH